MSQPPRPPPTQPLPQQPQQTPAQKREQERLLEIRTRQAKEREELLQKKDKSLADILIMLEDFQPLVSERETNFLSRFGYDCLN